VLVRKYNRLVFFVLIFAVFFQSQFTLPHLFAGSYSYGGSWLGSSVSDGPVIISPVALNAQEDLIDELFSNGSLSSLLWNELGRAVLGIIHPLCLHETTRLSNRSGNYLVFDTRYMFMSQRHQVVWRIGVTDAAMPLDIYFLRDTNLLQTGNLANRMIAAIRPIIEQQINDLQGKPVGGIRPAPSGGSTFIGDWRTGENSLLIVQDILIDSGNIVVTMKEKYEFVSMINSLPSKDRQLIRNDEENMQMLRNIAGKKFRARYQIEPNELDNASSFTIRTYWDDPNLSKILGLSIFFNNSRRISKIVVLTLIPFMGIVGNQYGWRIDLPCHQTHGVL
jgi:hypothetical protein